MKEAIDKPMAGVSTDSCRLCIKPPLSTSCILYFVIATNLCVGKQQKGRQMTFSLEKGDNWPVAKKERQLACWYCILPC